MAKSSLLLLTLAMTVPSFAGCSVAMALHGKQEPNFDGFEVGSHRNQVEVQLGSPVSSILQEDGKKEDTYQYEMANSPNGARATLYFYYDLATLGLAEPIFTLIELFQGHTEESRIVYDAEDRVASIQGYKLPQPSPQLKAAMEAQEHYIKRPTASKGMNQDLPADVESSEPNSQ